jgi:hypothetical protein
MYQVCKVLGLDVIPQTEFALHGGDLGYVMAKVTGGTIVKKDRVEIPRALKDTRRTIKEALQKEQKGDERAQVQIKKQGWKKEGGKYLPSLQRKRRGWRPRTTRAASFSMA